MMDKTQRMHGLAAAEIRKARALLAENQALRKVLANIASNLRIHLQVPTQSITLNRAEVEAMARECEVE